VYFSAIEMLHDIALYKLTVDIDILLRPSALINDLLFLPISTIESAVGKRLITVAFHAWLVHASVDTSSHIRLDFKREINTTTTVMN